MPDYQNIRDLSLYHFEACPYCVVTREAITALGLDLELRDIRRHPEYRRELIAGGGKAQVPSLRIGTAAGESHWLYESQDIIHYLRGYQKRLNEVA